jgi:diguanylate cyclase (GGDEF)-like protein/PAS domain S-box-containing protein
MSEQAKKTIHVLLVEDNPGDIRLIWEMLTDASRLMDYSGQVQFLPIFIPLQARQLSAALEKLAENTVDVVLLDLNLPDSSGIDTFNRIHESYPSLPLVILSGQDSQNTALMAMQQGAQDFLVKGQVDSPLLSRALLYAIERNRIREALHRNDSRYRQFAENVSDVIWTMNKDLSFTDFSPSVAHLLGYSVEEALKCNWEDLVTPDSFSRMIQFVVEELTPQKMAEYKTQPFWSDTRELEYVRRDGSTFWAEVKLSILYDSHGEPGGFLGVTRDISERKKIEQRLNYLATHDQLTNLPNRYLFLDRLTQALLRADRKQDGNVGKWMMAVMLMDLDHFKNINDSLGHGVGDVVLKLVAERLKGCIRKSDTIARLGGDEFTLIMEEISVPEDCTVAAQKIIDTIQIPLMLEGKDYQVSASIGISLYPRDGSDADTLLKHADIAMYRAKLNRGCYRFY